MAHGTAYQEKIDYRRGYKVFKIYDRFLTNVLSDLESDNPHLKRFYNK
jgi:hypothetical protein